MPWLETKWVVSGTVFGVLCWRRDVETAACILGAVINAFLAKVLKRVFNAARPVGAALTDPGMPSSHAQSLFYFASYLSLGAQHINATAQLRFIAPLCCFGLAGSLAFLRIRAGLHTALQVVVGACFGTASGAAWLSCQPSIVDWIRVQMRSSPVSERASVILLLVTAAVLVGSLERTVAAKLKAKLKRR
jgi:dolichyldiphosphatase